MTSALVVSKQKDALRHICSSFPDHAKVAGVLTTNEALDVLKKERYDFVFIDIEILRENSQSDEAYREAMEPYRRLYSTLKIVVMASQAMTKEAVLAVKSGANNYLNYPIDPEEVKLVADSIRESVILQAELDYLRDEFWASEWLETIETKSHSMREVYEMVRSVAPTRSAVLLIGETGTGKGVLANLIHRHSNRRKVQFIAAHCGAIPDTLLESELFGHEKGAFTGAVRRKLGKFEIASGGTLFLDEIGTITPLAQVKLLQVLQDGTFQRVGGEETLKADVRIISATNADLKEMTEKGRFRKDLYYRLNVFPIEIPPLRERIEDIPRLADVFLEKANRLNKKVIHGIDPGVLTAFARYPWPGNIRELENLIERAHILETSSLLRLESLPVEILESGMPVANLPLNSSLPLSEARQRAIGDFERTYLKELLTKNKASIKASAEAAGITSRQLHKLMAKYGIRREQFKAPPLPLEE